jgi:hypothetical protein
VYGLSLQRLLDHLIESNVTHLHCGPHRTRTIRPRKSTHSEHWESAKWDWAKWEPAKWDRESAKRDRLSGLRRTTTAALVAAVPYPPARPAHSLASSHVSLRTSTSGSDAGVARRRGPQCFGPRC